MEKINIKYCYSTVIMCIALLSTVLSSCISDYNHPDLEDLNDILVVEGTISNDSTLITLSKSVGINNELSDAVWIEDAILYVECDNGDKFQETIYDGNGNYIIKTGDLRPDQKYRLCITFKNKEYESEYLSPLFTPEIDSISWKKDSSEKASLRVSTHDPNNNSLYYKWSYEEHWELKAELFADAGFVDLSEIGQPIEEYTLENSNNIYYCWNNNRSRRFILGNSEKFAENIIKEKELFEMKPSNDRFSILYYIAVKQNQIRKEAYDYFSNLQKNIDQTGSIFAPIPSEMKGNIKSKQDPEELVIGYVDVSSTTYKERYIYEYEGLYEPAGSGCLSSVVEGWMPNRGYAIYEYRYLGTEKQILSSAPKECLDCRLRGTKNKPAFWPTDHL